MQGQCGGEVFGTLCLPFETNVTRIGFQASVEIPSATNDFELLQCLLCSEQIKGFKPMQWPSVRVIWQPKAARAAGWFPRSQHYLAVRKWNRRQHPTAPCCACILRLLRQTTFRVRKRSKVIKKMKPKPWLPWEVGLSLNRLIGGLGRHFSVEQKRHRV